MQKLERNLIFILLINLLPLIGILFFKWNPGVLLLMYWAETAAIAFFGFLKIMLSNLNPIIKALVLVVFPFVTFTFMLVHLGFAIALFAITFMSAANPAEIALTELRNVAIYFIGILALNAYFLYGERAWEKDGDLFGILGVTFGRIFLMQLAVLVGFNLAMPNLALGNTSGVGYAPIFAASIVILIKTAIDLLFGFFAARKTEPVVLSNSPKQ